MPAYKALGEIETDARGRISLARLGKKGLARYEVQEWPGGELRLMPVMSVKFRPVPESRSKAEFEETMHKSMDQAARGELVDLDDILSDHEAV